MTEKRDAAIDRFCSLQVKSLRTIANSFVDAVPMLMSVVGVLFFYMVRRFCILWPFRRTACHGTLASFACELGTTSQKRVREGSVY